MREPSARAASTPRRKSRAIDRDRRLFPVAAPRATSARAGLRLGGGCLGFFVAYVTLNLLHALKHDPTLVVTLAPIPLFARFLASGMCAVLAGLALGAAVRERARWLRRLPALLALAVALFVVTIVFFA